MSYKMQEGDRTCLFGCINICRIPRPRVQIASSRPSKCKPLFFWTRIYPAFANSVDPDQFASEEANWSGSAMFVIKYVNL